MIQRLFGAGTVSHALRGGLDDASRAHRVIAEQVARGTGSSAVSTAAAGEATGTDEELTRNMTALADTQLRFEATARLLQKTYADFRTAIRDRG